MSTSGKKEQTNRRIEAEGNLGQDKPGTGACRIKVVSVGVTVFPGGFIAINVGPSEEINPQELEEAVREMESSEAEKNKRTDMASESFVSFMDFIRGGAQADQGKDD
ncbi:hypothetical protein IJV57_02690 [Candidatus Saccharibacteria bacterium]|nr:hypothetical protein [Paludibacteraceae bacterium]MBQ9684359.1 hypothetical protein [Candidatus Saccharibacteria bacterium]